MNATDYLSVGSLSLTDNMKKYVPPRNLNPSHENLSRTGEKIAKNYTGLVNEPMILKPDPVKYGEKEFENEVLVLKEDEMISIHLKDGSFEINQEMSALIRQIFASLGLKTIEDLKRISEKEFFELFTPLMNDHYNLK